MTRVIIVEDHPDTRYAMRRVMEYADYVVSEANDGEEALALHRANPADMVITDLTMPRKDGLELTLELKKTSPAPLVIAYTGKAKDQSEYLGAARRVGADKTLFRPFSNEVLLEATRLLLERRGDHQEGTIRRHG